MIGDTITLTINSVAKTLNKINQDGFSADYFLKEATGEFYLKIRHQNESVKAGTEPMERHNVELRQTVYGVAPAPDSVRYYSFTMRQQKKDSGAVKDNALGVNAWATSATLVKLLGWES